MILTPPTPPPTPETTTNKTKKKIKGKTSLSPSHLEEHNCLSFTQLHKNEKQNVVVLKLVAGEKSAFLPQPWSGIILSENTSTPTAAHRHHHHQHTTTTTTKQASRSCVLLIHTSEWRLLHDSIDFPLVYFVSSVSYQLMFKVRIKVLFYFLVLTHFKDFTLALKL